MKIIKLVMMLFFLSGCATNLPVAFIGQDGRVLTGVNKVSLTEGSFSVTDGELTCAGTYNPLQQSKTISMPVICNDGRKGIIRSTRDTGLSGSGTVILDDGYKGDFLFGSAAEGF